MSDILYFNGGIYEYLNKKFDKSMFLMRVTESEIVSVVNEPSFEKSTYYIGLNMGIIKQVIPNIAKPLCYIILYISYIYILYICHIYLSWMVDFQIR